MLEIVCCRPVDALIAVENGATQIELCVAIEQGGLTPSRGLLKTVRELVSVPIFAMLRPRPGGFCYDEHEFRAMVRDAEGLLEDGADGLVFGILNLNQTLDEARNCYLVNLCEERPCVLHRSFDRTPDLEASLRAAHDAGFHRILSSGGSAAAAEGATELRRLDQLNLVPMLPGGGIRAHNAGEVLRVTGISRLHAAPFVSDRSDPDARTTDGAAVLALSEALKQYGTLCPDTQYL